MKAKMDEDQNGRMTRACKRGRPSQTNDLKAVRTPGRGRAESLASLVEEQNTRRFTSEQMPNVTVHYSNAGPIPSTRQQPPALYARRTNNQRTEAAVQQQAIYPPQQEQTRTYSRTTRNMGSRDPNVAQVLYPNMMQAPVSNQYTVRNPIPQTSAPEQQATEYRYNTRTVRNPIPQTPAPEQQATEYRYNTRKSVHSLNLPLSTVSNMTNYWNSTKDSNPETSHVVPQTQKLPTTSHVVPQTQKLPTTENTRQTQQNKLCPEFKSTETQTVLSLRDDDVKLIKTLRSKRMDPNHLNCTIENNNIVVTYNDVERSGTVDTLVKQSQDYKMNVYAKLAASVYENYIPGLIPIEYHGSDNNNTSNDSESGFSSGNSSTLLQSLLHAPEELADAASINSESEIATSPPQNEVPQERAARQGMFPIPTIFDQRNNNNRRYNAYHYPARPQIRPQFNPFHFLQNLQNNPHMYMNNHQNNLRMHVDAQQNNPHINMDAMQNNARMFMNALQNNPRMHMHTRQNNPHMNGNFHPHINSPEQVGMPAWLKK